MSSEQITQETVPVETTTPTETVTPTTQPTTETKPEVSTTTTTTTSSWKDSISEAYRNDPNIEKFTEIDALAKSYINATKMIGQDKVVIPTNNSTEEHWDDVYAKLGRPESADKYSLDAKAGALAKANINPEVLDMTLQNGTRLGDHPEIIKGFAKIAGMMQEDKIVATESENAQSVSNIEEEISSIINDRNGPYWNKQHPDHDKMVQQVYTLREMLNAK